MPGLTQGLAPVEAGRADGSVYTALLTCILTAARFWLAKILRISFSSDVLTARIPTCAHMLLSAD